MWNLTCWRRPLGRRLRLPAPQDACWHSNGNCPRRHITEYDGIRTYYSAVPHADRSNQLRADPNLHVVADDGCA